MGTRDEYVASVKTAFVSIATRLTLAWAASLTNGLTSTFFISKFLEYSFNKLFNYLANQSELGIFFLYIDTRVGQQGKDFEEAAYKNREVQLNGTKEEKQKAEDYLWAKFKILASLKS